MIVIIKEMIHNCAFLSVMYHHKEVNHIVFCKSQRDLKNAAEKLRPVIGKMTTTCLQYAPLKHLTSVHLNTSSSTISKIIEPNRVQNVWVFPTSSEYNFLSVVTQNTKRWWDRDYFQMEKTKYITPCNSVHLK